MQSNEEGVPPVSIGWEEVAWEKEEAWTGHQD